MTADITTCGSVTTEADFSFMQSRSRTHAPVYKKGNASIFNAMLRVWCKRLSPSDFEASLGESLDSWEETACQRRSLGSDTGLTHAKPASFSAVAAYRTIVRVIIVTLTITMLLRVTAAGQCCLSTMLACLDLPQEHSESERLRAYGAPIGRSPVGERDPG